MQEGVFIIIIIIPLVRSLKGSISRQRQGAGQSKGEREPERASLRDGGTKNSVSRKRNEPARDMDGIKWTWILRTDIIIEQQMTTRGKIPSLLLWWT